MDSQKALKYIEEDLYFDEDLQNISRYLFLVLYEKNPDSFRHITRSILNEILMKSDVELNDQLLSLSLGYLTGVRVPILNSKFEYIDENDISHNISLREIKEIIDSGEFFHPEEGYSVRDFGAKIFQYYSINKNFGEYS